MVAFPVAPIGGRITNHRMVDMKKQYIAMYQTRANSPFKVLNGAADEIVVTSTHDKDDQICVIGWNHVDEPHNGLVFKEDISTFDTAKIVITVAPA